MPLIAVICVTFGVSSSSMWSRTHTMLQVWFLPRFEGKKAFWKPWTGAVWWTNWVFTIQGGHISIYAASLFKIHTQSIHFAHCIVLIMGFICFFCFFVFQFIFNQEVKCKEVCKKTYKKGARQDMAKLDFLKMGMQLNYQHHWLVFNIRVYW